MSNPIIYAFTRDDLRSLARKLMGRFMSRIQSKVKVAHFLNNRGRSEIREQKIFGQCWKSSDDLLTTQIKSIIRQEEVLVDP